MITSVLQATHRPRAVAQVEATVLATEHLSRAVVGKVLVSGISVQVEPGEVQPDVAPRAVLYLILFPVRRSPVNVGRRAE